MYKDDVRFLTDYEKHQGYKQRLKSGLKRGCWLGVLITTLLAYALLVLCTFFDPNETRNEMSTLLQSVQQMNPHIKMPDGTIKPMTEKQRQLAVKAWNVNIEAKAQAEELKNLKGELEQTFGVGSSYEVPGLTKGSVAPTDRVTVSAPDILKEVLGKDFKSLVNSDTVFKPTDALKSIAFDGDDPRSEKLRECLSIQSGVTVTLLVSTSKAG